jgi:hypothetical protein
MSGISFILSMFFLIILSLIILILVYPTKISFTLFSKGLSTDAEINFNLLHGFIRGFISSYTEDSSFKLYLAIFPIYDTKQRKMQEKEAKPRKRENWLSPDRVSLLLGLIGPIVRLLRAVLRHIHVKELDCHFDVGFPDPVQTGMFCGIYYPILETIQPFIPNGSFTITPVFTKEVFATSVKGSISLRIALILVPLIKLLTNKEFRMIRRRRD